MMRRVARAALLAVLFFPGFGTGQRQTDPEIRVLEYIRDHLRPGQPLIVTELYNNVFTEPGERQALNKLYKAFFRIPLFVAQYDQRFERPPSLKEIAEQFDLRSREAANILVRVAEADPRMPRFFTRDPQSGEIATVDRAKILGDPRFGSDTERQLGDWEGRAAPDFSLEALEGAQLDAASLRGKAAVIYVWFTGCPPCLKETPELVALARAFSDEGLVIVAANADRLLGLAYDDSTRRRHIQEQGASFPVVHWNRDADTAFGRINIYPTLFLIDRTGVIARHWVGFTSGEELRRTVASVLKAAKARE